MMIEAVHPPAVESRQPQEQKLRVAYLLHRFPHLTETFIMREIHTLRQQGVEVEIFSLLPPEHEVVHQEAQQLLPFTHYASLLSPTVIRAQLAFLRRSPVRYARAFYKVLRQTWREPLVLARALILFPLSVYFAGQIEARKIDHIHAHFVWLGAIAASVVSELVGTTFSIHPHAFGLFWRNQQDVRYQLQNARKIITISSYHAAYIANLCPRIAEEDVAVVHLGIEVARFTPGEKREGGPARILSVGRLIEKKGHQFLVEACRLLSERGVDYRCDIVGEGPLRERLLQMIDQYGLGERVVLRGALDQAEVLQAYQQSDLFVLPCIRTAKGDQDGMPYVLIEAMACELPVVTTALSGIPDLVQEGVTGAFAAEQDVNGLADVLARLIAEPEQRRRLGRQGRERVLADFQTQKNVARMKTEFAEIAEGARGTRQ